MSSAIRVTVRCFASLRDVAAERLSLDLSAGSSVADAWDELAARHPGAAPHREFVRAARNRAYAGWGDALEDGDEVAFLPPVAGGGEATIGLTDAPIDVGALEAAVAGPSHGAVVTFVGRARDQADDGRRVLELEYEAYPEMAESALRSIAGEASERWSAEVAVVHRVGVLQIGEPAVAIVTAAAHRAEAYEANRFVIEAIKLRLPVWKRERFANGSEWKRPGA